MLSTRLVGGIRASRKGKTMDKTKVLIVDDEVEFSSTLAERMTNRGLTVETVANGVDAVARIDKGSFDAIVLDMVMPGMDGIETLKRIREKKPDLQIILLTGHASLEKGIESIKLGALDFLEKPADLAQLLAKIQEAKARRIMLVEKKMENNIKEILLRKGM
jgi:DNA-binding NtrC family response regulator